MWSLPVNICVCLHGHLKITWLVFCYCCIIVQGSTLFSSATSGSSSTLKAKISIFLGKTKVVRVFQCSNYFLSLSNIQVHRVAHLQYQKQKLYSSCFGKQFAQLNSTIQDQRMCILFLGCFFPFESSRMGYEYSASGKILSSSLQNVKLKAIGVHNHSALVILNITERKREGVC